MSECYSDHNEDIRTKGSCDYCGGDWSITCPDCGCSFDRPSPWRDCYYRHHHKGER